jgi:hypothetical protein
MLWLERTGRTLPFCIIARQIPTESSPLSLVQVWLPPNNSPYIPYFLYSEDPTKDMENYIEKKGIQTQSMDDWIEGKSNVKHI